MAGGVGATATATNEAGRRWTVDGARDPSWGQNGVGATESALDGRWRAGSILGSKNKINVCRNSILNDASQISKFHIEILGTVFRLGSTFQDSMSVIFIFSTSVKFQKS